MAAWPEAPHRHVPSLAVMERCAASTPWHGGAPELLHAGPERHEQREARGDLGALPPGPQAAVHLARAQQPPRAVQQAPRVQAAPDHLRRVHQVADAPAQRCAQHAACLAGAGVGCRCAPAAQCARCYTSMCASGGLCAPGRGWGRLHAAIGARCCTHFPAQAADVHAGMSSTPAVTCAWRAPARHSVRARCFGLSSTAHSPAGGSRAKHQGKPHPTQHKRYGGIKSADHSRCLCRLHRIVRGVVHRRGPCAARPSPRAAQVRSARLPPHAPNAERSPEVHRVTGHELQYARARSS